MSYNLIDMDCDFEDALTALDSLIKGFEKEGWTDLNEYEDDWVLKTSRPALFAIKHAKRNLERAQALLADDIKEALDQFARDEQATGENWEEV